MVEEYFGQEIPIAHFDLIILTGEARELVFRNSNEMSITEEMIWATKGYFEARGKQVEYSFDLRIPPGYTSSEFVASPEDEVLNFLENIFIRKDEAFSRRLQNAITQREIAIGLSIDPELPAYQNNQLLYNSSPLTGKSINNIYFTYRWLYEKTFNANPGEVFVYLAGTTMSDAFIRELGQMNPNVGLVHAGIGVQSHKREALDRWSEGLGSTSWTRGIMLYLAHFSPYLETEQYRDDLGGVESRNLLTREEYEQMMQEQVHEAFRSTKDSFVNTVALQ